MLQNMTLTETLAALFALYVIAVSIGAIFDSKAIGHVVEEMRRSVALTYIAGILTFLLGGTLVALHNDWSNGLAVFVSLIGWATLIKGSLILAARPMFLSLYDKIVFAPAMVRGVGCVMLAVGVVLLYCAL